MHTDLKGALEHLEKIYRSFEHNGKRLQKQEVKIILEYGIKKGYKTSSEFSNEEIDEILNLLK